MTSAGPSGLPLAGHSVFEVGGHSVDADRVAHGRVDRGPGVGRRHVDPITGRRQRATGHAKALKNARYALWKNPEDLTGPQQAKLAWIAMTDPHLYRAYLLKEGLRVIFRLPHDQALDALDRWISWARRSRIPAFVDLQRTIVKHKTAILASIEHGLSNGRIESVNPQRLGRTTMTRRRHTHISAANPTFLPLTPGGF